MKWIVRAAFSAAMMMGGFAQAAPVVDVYASFAPNVFGSADWNPYFANVVEAIRNGGATTGTGTQQFHDINNTGGHSQANVIVTDGTEVGQIGDRGSRLYFWTGITDDAGGKVRIGAGGLQPIYTRTHMFTEVNATASAYALVTGFDCDAGGRTQVFTGNSRDSTGDADLVLVYAGYGFEISGPDTTEGFQFVFNNLHYPLFEQTDPDWSAGALTATTGQLFLSLADFTAGNAYEDEISVGFQVPEPAAVGLLGLGMFGLACLRRRKA